MIGSDPGEELIAPVVPEPSMPSPIPTLADLAAQLDAEAEKTKPKKPRKKKSLAEDVATPPQRPSTEAFLDHFFAFAGGPAAVAKMLYTEFVNANQGSLIRQRILEMVMRNMKAADAKGTPLDDISALGEDDLMREITARERAMAEYYQSHANEPGCPAAGPPPGNPGTPPPGPKPR